MTGQQLKNSILQMAVQGKLVPQDPNDEPASVLLERIRKEKEQLIKEGKIKKEKNPSYIFRGADNLPYEKVGKNEPVCIADEVPFEIPESWEWVRLGSIGDWGSGATPSRSIPEYYGGGIPWLKTSDLNDGYIEYIPENISRLALEKTSVRLNPTGSVLIAMYGATIGKVGILTFPATTNQACCACLPIEIYNEYVFYFLMSQKVAFVKQGEGGAQPNISKEKIVATLMPLPPLAEQYRIVAKIKEALPYVERYGEACSTANSLNAAFPNLLKKSILQEAVQGKLVPQDPADEPASVLLECIRAEKEQLIKAGKIKRDKHESVIFRRDNSHYEKRDSEEVCIDEELPFKIPDNWEWTKLSDLVQFIGGYAYKSESFIKKSEYQVLRLGNVKNDEIRYSVKPVFISKELAEKTADFRCKPNDILLTMTGTRLKRDYFYTVAISNKDTNYFVNQRVGCLRGYHPDIYRWLIWVLKSEGILSQVFKYETGTANQGNLGAENIMKTFIPLPPINEQNRIFTMIERLLKKAGAL